MSNPHPWYGPCDALGPNGECVECTRNSVDPVEIMARAVRRARFERTHRIKAYDAEVPPTENELADQRAALAALREAGFKVLPRSASEAIVKAGREFTIEAIWQAMWEVAE